MMKDPILDEVRKNRAEIAEACGYDLARMIAHAAETADKISGLRYATHEEILSPAKRSKIDKPQVK